MVDKEISLEDLWQLIQDIALPVVLVCLVFLGIVASRFGSLILFGYNMPDKQLLLTVTETKKITFTLKVGVDYVNVKGSIDLKRNPRETVEWDWFDFENTDELLKMVDMMTFLI